MVKLMILVMTMTSSDRACVMYIDICESLSRNVEFVVDGDTISQSDKNFIKLYFLVRKSKLF